ncbi:E3 ubiquitin-protein ligase RNF185 [Linum perenne]
MASEFGEFSSVPQPESSNYSENNSGDAGDFECNICFELAQDPIVTLCGHLFCWPCLYRWLHHHSNSHECPVCKALIQEEKLVPLYGRGKMQGDPRSKSYPGIDEIPRRPAGQRPETAPPPNDNAFPPNFSFGSMGGFVPMVSTRIGNLTLSSAFGGLSLFPSLFNVQYHGFHDAAVYGSTSGFPYGFHNFHGGHANWFPPPSSRTQQADNVLKNLLLLIGFIVVLALLWW